MDNKAEINKKIAEMLRFKQDDYGYWIYPPGWYDERSSSPQHTIPDFVQMIEICRNTARLFKYGIPRQ